MKLTHIAEYERRGLDAKGIKRLATLGEMLLTAGFNVTGIQEPEQIERMHFLDSLSLLDVSVITSACQAVDIGSGAGLPALVLALALPSLEVTALEANQKKCHFIERAAQALGLLNVRVCCERAEEHGRGSFRGGYDVAISRALATLPVVAEYSLPLLKEHGYMVAMKGAVSDQERIQGQRALDILGGGALEALRLEPFPGAENRWVYIVKKVASTPGRYPRRPGMPSKRPVGGAREQPG